MQKQLRIGIVGVGNRGACLARNVLDSGLATVVGGMDAFPEQARKFMQYHKLDFPLSTSRDALLADRLLDGVIVATPDDCHAADACAALRAGKAVFCEKPMAISIEDCDAMLRTQSETGGALRIGFNLRFHPMIRAMREIVQAGELGRLTAVWVRHFVGHGGNFYFQDWHSLKERANSLLLQKATHDFDVIHFVSGRFTRRVVALGGRAYYGGDRPNDLTCPACDERFTCPEAMLDSDNYRRQCAFRKEIDIEDNEMVMMEMEDGILANYSQCQFTPDYHRSYVFIGTQGRLETFMTQHRRGGWQREDRLEVLYRDLRPAKTYHFPAVNAAEGHGGADPLMVRDWLRCVQTGETDRDNPIAGRQSVAVGCLAARSLRGGNAWEKLPRLPAT
ncbi:MAG: Gfo/Idh/MocA family oxidoreductase [Kiritimatiellae bacterium]|nr:Gfo/Idh/MocA family oxidoreductase [Kiritimatiellia bacterium]